MIMFAEKVVIRVYDVFFVVKQLLKKFFWAVEGNRMILSGR